MAKMIKRNSKELDYLNYGKGDPVLDLLRKLLSNDINKWKFIVENDMKCRKERQQKEINKIKRYKL